MTFRLAHAAIEDLEAINDYPVYAWDIDGDAITIFEGIAANHSH